MPAQDSNDHTTNQKSRCEIDKTLVGAECQKPGEVSLDGRLLCVDHAKLLKLEGRSETLLGMVFEMDQWLDRVDGQADGLRVRRVERQRNETVEELRFIRKQVELIRGDLSPDGSGQT